MSHWTEDYLCRIERKLSIFAASHCVILVLLLILLVLTCAGPAHADTITARCESNCTVGLHEARGPGRMAVALEMHDDAFAVPQRLILRVKRGEYAKLVLDPAFIAAWQAAYSIPCIHFKWRWIGKLPRGVSGEWSEVSGWCLGADGS